jgi:outer membrane protein
MNRSLTFVFLLASGFALGAAAQTPPAPAAPAGPSRIAVIAFQATVGQTNEGQRNFADLQRKYEPKRQQLKALSDDIDSLTKQLQTQGDKLSDAERANRAKTIDDKKKQLDRSAEDARNDYQGEMRELYNGLASKVYDVLASYAQQRGYTLVLDMGQQQSPVLFANPATDITKAVRGLQREVGCARSGGATGRRRARAGPPARQASHCALETQAATRTKVPGAGPLCLPWGLVKDKERTDCRAARENPLPHRALWKKLWITSANPAQKPQFFLLSTLAGF